VKPIAIFQHYRLSGGDPPINFDWAIQILIEQFLALQNSGLSAAASEIYVGVNGGETDAMAAMSIAPAKAIIMQHPDDTRGELPTLNAVWQWARSHPGWLCYYQHTKAATHTGDQLYTNWRHCMERVCVNGWRDCVKALEHGFDMAGAHWLSSDRYANIGPPFFGGNFWWATSEFLMTLPEIPKTARTRGEFYQAEVWVSQGPRLPRIREWAQHWPGAACAAFV